MQILSFHSKKNTQTSVNETLNNKHVVNHIALTEVKLLNYQQLSEKIKHNILDSNTIAITSQNAAKWLAFNVNNWDGEIYTNSPKSERILQQMPNVKIHVSPSGYAHDLGMLIQESGIKSITHLTGNLGLSTLYEMTKSHQINYQRIEVYETQLTPKHCGLDQVDVCIFTSPSQVDSFFKVNTWKKSIFALCIGKTTATSLEHYEVESSYIYYPQEANYQAMVNLLPEIEKNIEQQKTK